MELIAIQQPGKVVFGDGALDKFIADYIVAGYQKMYLLTIEPVLGQLSQLFDKLKEAGVECVVNTQIAAEPSFADFSTILTEARDFGADSVVGIGGGSVLDVAKFLAAMINNTQDIRSVIGINFLENHKVYMACLPTTAGTGSEVSPNAIFLDEVDGGKKGVISPYLVPDAAYVDPMLTINVPASVTAATGIDALTHCIEAYINNFSHPFVDLYALEGVRLIYENLKAACDNGADLNARSAVALGSMYGGMCLGPVNTAAVHALAYPLGSEYKVPHGLSNALLLPYVMEYNMPEATERLAKVAVALGVSSGADQEQSALALVLALKKLIADCGLPTKLSEINIPQEDIEQMAVAAMKVERLLKNNVKKLAIDDVIAIYRKAL